MESAITRTLTVLAVAVCRIRLITIKTKNNPWPALETTNNTERSILLAIQIMIIKSEATAIKDPFRVCCNDSADKRKMQENKKS